MTSDPYAVMLPSRNSRATTQQHIDFEIEFSCTFCGSWTASCQMCRKRTDTVGQPLSAEISVLNMPSWKAKKAEETSPRKSTPRTLKEVNEMDPPLCGAIVIRQNGERGR